MFTPEDVRELERRGIPVEEGRRQLDLLSGPRRPVELLRPCTIGDGIVRLAPEEFEGLHELHAEAARAGRCIKFVPASGAASRMFRSLSFFLHGAGKGTSWPTVEAQARAGHEASAELVMFLGGLERLAFHDELRQELARAGYDLRSLAGAGRYGPILEALLGSAGLDYARKPKGLLRFHRCGASGRTAFEEHLLEAAGQACDASGVCRLHFTIAPGQRPQFEDAARRAADGRLVAGARFEIGYSTQDPATDTLSLDLAGRPRRDAQGRLLFRPGGHGALIGNLEALPADLVLLKNIDNVQPERSRPAVSRFRRALAGLLVRLEAEVFRRLDELSRPAPGPASIAAARTLLCDVLHVDVGADAPATALVTWLDRPLRVVGVVPQSGEPGGGPFWVRGSDGRASLQIVEASQVDPTDERQRAILRSATHFNPVDLVCALRDRRGRAFELTRFIDHEAVIVTTKSEGGEELRALERPGLWNGAMAGWNTVFVEIPLECFTPVKTIVDLLRPEHQP